MNKMKVCIWPDSTWCPLSQIDGYGWKSDDYKIVEVDEDKLEELEDINNPIFSSNKTKSF